jgi:hypothetical protein
MYNFIQSYIINFFEQVYTKTINEYPICIVRCIITLPPLQNIICSSILNWTTRRPSLTPSPRRHQDHRQAKLGGSRQGPLIRVVVAGFIGGGGWGSMWQWQRACLVGDKGHTTSPRRRYLLELVITMFCMYQKASSRWSSQLLPLPSGETLHPWIRWWWCSYVVISLGASSWSHVLDKGTNGWHRWRRLACGLSGVASTASISPSLGCVAFTEILFHIFWWSEVVSENIEHDGFFNTK